MYSVYLHSYYNLIDSIFMQIAAIVIPDIYFSLSLLSVSVYHVWLYDEKEKKAEITSSLSWHVWLTNLWLSDNDDNDFIQLLR